MKVSRVSEMRELDRTASKQFGIKEELLMENAGPSLYLWQDAILGEEDRMMFVTEMLR